GRGGGGISRPGISADWRCSGGQPGGAGPAGFHELAISHGLDRAPAQLGRIHFPRKLWPAAFAHIERVEARKWTRAIRSHVAGTFQTRTDRATAEGIRVPAPINPRECSFHRALA